MNKQSKQSLFKTELAKTLGLHPDALGNRTHGGKAPVVDFTQLRVTRYYAQRDSIAKMGDVFRALPDIKAATVITYTPGGRVELTKTREEFDNDWRDVFEADGPVADLADRVRDYTDAYYREGHGRRTWLAEVLHTLAAWVRRQRGK